MAHFEWENANGRPSIASSPLQESKQLKVNAIESASRGITRIMIKVMIMLTIKVGLIFTRKWRKD